MKQLSKISNWIWGLSYKHYLFKILDKKNGAIFQTYF